MTLTFVLVIVDYLVSCKQFGGGMGEEAGSPANARNLVADGRPSYWLDACEDVSCDDYFVDFGPGTTNSVPVPEPHSGGCTDPGFFGGIDQILDSIKNGGTDIVNSTPTNGVSNGTHISPAPQVCVQDQRSLSKNAVNNGNGQSLVVSSNSSKNDKSNLGKRSHEVNGSEQRRDKKVRGRDPMERKVWDRAPRRKRQRGWDDMESDGQLRDQVRRKERHGAGNWKDRDHREARGYWEREKVTNELVFRTGSWEACKNRDEKANAQKNNKYSGCSEETKPEQPTEKPPEEQARQYQLDVLDQAKKRNTIAFLETGAGKTLIAVLLMKSISAELQKQNKKMLAVFLVPKVPLVYQV